MLVKNTRLESYCTRVCFNGEARPSKQRVRCSSAAVPCAPRAALRIVLPSPASGENRE